MLLGARRRTLLLVALGLIAAGGFLAWAVQTDVGAIEVREVTIPGPNGIFQHGRLYVPPGATAEEPAPGIVAIHGYINTNETQSGFAVEFARRGWVVLAPDQTGHGYSDPPVGANGFGGPPALAFLRSLDFVDGQNVGLEGHSMGGWASMAAARTFPDGYRSIVLEGSSVTGPGAAPDPSAPPVRNVAVVFSRFDEFSSLMWGVPVAGDVAGTEALTGFFGTDGPVAVGEVYGSVDDGTARVLHQPPVTHPGDHHSRAAIGHAVAWFQRTLDGGSDLPASDQVWYWKELGTLLGLVGMVLLLFPVASMLLDARFFSELREPPAPARGARGAGWWGTALVVFALPPATLFPFVGLFDSWGLSPSAWLAQNVTTQILIWAVLVGVVSLVLFGAWHLATNRSSDDVRGGAPEVSAGDAYGLTWGGRLRWGRIGKSFLLALLVVGAGYGTLVLTDFFFGTDYRFWVFAVKPMSPLHLRIALPYLVPFTAFFLVVAVVLHGQLRRPEEDRDPSGSPGGRGPARDPGEGRRAALRNVVLLAGGFVVLLALQYAPLLAGGSLLIASEPLWTIIAFQFVPILALVALVSTYFFRATGHVWAGAFASGLLVTWIVVASQAVHHPF